MLLVESLLDMVVDGNDLIDCSLEVVPARLQKSA